MPKKSTSQKDNAEHDLTSVRSLVVSVAPLARHLKLTENGIRRWFKVNRIPGAHIIEVANFYNVEIRDLLPLTGSDLSAPPVVVLKPKCVLQVLVEVREGRMTLAEAVEKTGQSERSLKLVLIHWGEQIRTLYETMEGLDAKTMTLEDACVNLGLAKYTVHGLRRKYGYAPGPVKRTRPIPTIETRRAVLNDAAMRVIAGKESVAGAAEKRGMSARNLFRTIEKICPLSVMELSRFPDTFRMAYADEVGSRAPKYVEKWLEIAKQANLFIHKQTKYPKSPDSWKNLPIKRLLIGALLGEGKVDEIASSRGGEPVVLEGLFTSELRPLDLTWQEVKKMGLNHQTALAEFLIWQLDRKRKMPE